MIGVFRKYEMELKCSERVYITDGVVRIRSSFGKDKRGWHVWRFSKM
jgi:hypothetical protein